MKNLKKLTVVASFALLCLLTIAVCACNKITNPPKAVTVTFRSDGAVYQTIEVKADAVMPADPVKSDSTFDGWFIDDVTFLQSFTSLSGVSASVTVYAKWIEGHTHSYGEWTVKIPATCTAAATMERVCLHDATHKEESRTTFALGHSWEWVFTTPVTETTDGEETNTCSRCGETDGTRIAYAVGTPGLAYTLIAGGKAYGVSAGTAAEAGITEMVIPSMHNNLPVTSIDRAAFSGCTALTSITLPFIGSSLGVTSNTHFGHIFGATSYNNQNSSIPASLKTVILTGSTGIGNYAFYRCSNLTGVTVSESVTRIGSSAFYGCTALANITIPSGVVNIGENAFSGTDWLGNQSDGLVYAGRVLYAYKGTMPEGTAINDIRADTVAVSNKVFSGCTSLTSITLPSGVASIGSSAFSGCTSLTSITLPFVGNTLNQSSNTHFGYIFGSEYYNNQNSYLPPSLKTVILTGGNRIDENAFSGCSNLTDITVSENMTYIGSGAFNKCTALTSIAVPSGVKSIGYAAFSGCTALSSITLPFVGNTLNGALNTNFGYIFGSTAYISQHGSIPPSLKTVVLTGGTGIGDNTFYGCKNLTDITIPESATSVGEHAFYGCTALASIVLPSDIASIGSAAFTNCASLTSIVLPSGVSYIADGAFSNCVSLEGISVDFGNTTFKSINGVLFNYEGTTLLYYPMGKNETDYTVPNGVTDIRGRTFYNCNKLVGITIPVSVTAIGDAAFYNCAALTSISVDSGNTAFKSINGVLFDYAVTALICYPAQKTETAYNIPSSVRSIFEYAFYDCAALTAVTLPDGLANIGNSAFRGCKNLAEINIPSNITAIGDATFYGCSALASITLPDNLTSIGDSAFYICSKLTEVIIPSGVTRIGDYTFADCAALETVTLPDNLTSIGNSAFSSCVSLLSIVLPDNLTSIGDSAFNNCNKLTEIIVPSSVTSIGERTFFMCNSLTSITLPFVGNTLNGRQNFQFGYIFGGSLIDFSDQASFIPPHLKTVIITGGKSLYTAFYGCSKITCIILPSSVTSIDTSFYGCSALTSITLAANVTSIDYLSFSECSKLTIYTEWTAKPSGWRSDSSSSWNASNRPVMWGCTLSEDKTYVTSFTKTSANIQNSDASNGISAPCRVGYIFDGWYTNSEFTGDSVSAADIATAENGTYYAKWVLP